MKNYIITGACGHLAGAIIRELSTTDCGIYGLVLPWQTPAKNERVKYFFGDVTKPESLDGIFSAPDSEDTVVIHTAGLISISDKPDQKLFEVNVTGTKNILKKCMEYSVKRLVYVSSVHAIPQLPKKKVITEDCCFDPELVVGGYAKTKAEATREVLQAAKNGLDAVVVLPSGIFGAGDSENTNLLNRLIQNAAEGKLVAGVKGGYDLVDVEDVARGCISAATMGKSGECYILSGEYCTIKHLLELIRSLVPAKRIPILPLWAAKAMVPLMGWISRREKKQPLFTNYSLHVLSENSRFSHSKAQRFLSYYPRPIKTTLRCLVRA